MGSGSVPNSATDDEELTNGEPTELVSFCSVNIGDKEKLRKSGKLRFYGNFSDFKYYILTIFF